MHSYIPCWLTCLQMSWIYSRNRRSNIRKLIDYSCWDSVFDLYSDVFLRWVSSNYTVNSSWILHIYHILSWQNYFILRRSVFIFYFHFWPTTCFICFINRNSRKFLRSKFKTCRLRDIMEVMILLNLVLFLFFHDFVGIPLDTCIFQKLILGPSHPKLIFRF